MNEYCRCLNCTEQQKQFQQVRNLLLYENFRCYKCQKQTSHQFNHEDKIIYTCLEHSRNFDPKFETYLSVVKRYEALLWRLYPYKTVLFEEDANKIIENDHNLKKYTILRQKSEEKRLKECLLR